MTTMINSTIRQLAYFHTPRNNKTKPKLVPTIPAVPTTNLETLAEPNKNSMFDKLDQLISVRKKDLEMALDLIDPTDETNNLGHVKELLAIRLELEKLQSIRDVNYDRHASRYSNK